MKMLNSPENPAFKDSHKHCKLWAFGTSFVRRESGKRTRALRGQGGRAGMRAPASGVGADLDAVPPLSCHRNKLTSGVDKNGHSDGPGVTAAWVPRSTHVDCPQNLLFNRCS